MFFFLSLSLFIVTLFMFTLPPQHVAKSYWKDLATCGGEAEPRGFNGLCRRSKEDRARKTKIGGKQLNDLEEETSKLADGVTAALVIDEEHMSDCPYKAQAYIRQCLGEEPIQRYWREEFSKSLGRGGCTFGIEIDSFERRWGVDWEEMMKCGIDGRARMEKRTRRDAKWKLRTRQDRSLRNRLVQYTYGALKVVQELVVVLQIQCMAVCDGKTRSLSLECSETVEIPQTATQRKGGQCPCRGAKAFSHHSKKKNAWLSPPGSRVKSQIACVVKIVLCELRLERKPRSMSCNLHHLLFSFQFFCNIFSCKMSPHPFFTVSLHILRFFECFTILIWKCFSNNPCILTRTQFCSFWRIFFFFEFFFLKFFI